MTTESPRQDEDRATAGARPRDGLNGTYRMLLPDGWFRIDLAPERRGQAVKALVERQFAGLDNAPLLKQQTYQELMSRADEAYRNGGVDLYLSMQSAGLLTIPASLVVTRYQPPRPGGLPLEDLADHLRERGGQDEVATGELPAGPAVRTRRRSLPEGEETNDVLPTTSVDYYVQVPGSEDMLLLSFATPLDPLRDALCELFDAVAGSLVWTE